MKIGLFIPCYINAIYPGVGVASYKLLTSLGLDVDYPLDQTCCGQPMANGGFERDSTELAKRMEGLFEKYDYVVGPSASYVVFVKEHYPRLLNREEHACISSRIYEICEFLHDVVKVDKLNASFPHKVSIHNSCHGERLLHLSSPSELMIPRYSKWKCSSLSGWMSVAVSGECSRWRNRRRPCAWDRIRCMIICQPGRNTSRERIVLA